MRESGHYVGCDGRTRAQLETALGLKLDVGYPGGDLDAPALVFIEASADPSRCGELPGGNVFAGCRALKDVDGVLVFLLVQPDDPITPELARFCLADGSIEVGSDGLLEDADVIRARLTPHQQSVQTDNLLARLEREIASDEGRQHSALQRMLAESTEETLLDQMVDRETGVFDGPFASFKLDEEFKRATRFHQPLSLLLVEVFPAPLGSEITAEDRRVLLADIAGVFLNECRDIDVLARFTENVFMVLMPGTGVAGATVLAKRILSELRDRMFSKDRRLEPFAGLATIPASGIQKRQEFLARAEACLKLAKDGRGDGQGFCAYSE